MSRRRRALRRSGLHSNAFRSHLYWTNWNESSPSIQRALITGKQLQTIVSTDILMPNGLALDHGARKLYWADARLDKIECMHYDGSHRQVRPRARVPHSHSVRPLTGTVTQIVTQSRSEHPFDVAVSGDWVFWTDWVAHGVFRADKRAGGVVALRKDVPRPMGLVVVAEDHQRCTHNPCYDFNGGCSDVCTFNATGGISCGCRAGALLAPDGLSCVPAERRCADGQFACAEGPCVPAELVCDGVRHCSDRADASDEDLYYCSECSALRPPRAGRPH